MRYLIAAAFMTLTLTGCVVTRTGTTSSPNLTPEPAPLSEVTRPPSPPPSPVAESKSATAVVPATTSSKRVVIQLTATQFEWVPATVRVPFGAHVKLVIKSEDVTHGIAIREFNIRQDIPAGETVDVEFDATKRGEFTIFCSVFCGAGHSEMRGKLIVE